MKLCRLGLYLTIPLKRALGDLFAMHAITAFGPRKRLDDPKEEAG